MLRIFSVFSQVTKICKIAKKIKQNKTKNKKQKQKKTLFKHTQVHSLNACVWQKEQNDNTYLKITWLLVYQKTNKQTKTTNKKTRKRKRKTATKYTRKHDKGKEMEVSKKTERRKKQEPAGMQPSCFRLPKYGANQNPVIITLHSAFVELRWTIFTFGNF